ncbi:MAG TPA: hypothetical protein OIM61_08995 [Clostridiaceae bacterium]|nr:hypothetical protein [Clostridiaceae bacterium]
MQKEDFEEVAKHINILNVAYHLSLEITDTKGIEVKAICPFCGYNKNSKVATLSLNTNNNKYCCSRCGVGGFSIGLYAKLRNIDNKKAYRELLDRECFSVDKSNITISPINEIADIDTRDKIYREFLQMLKLEPQHRKYLKSQGFLNSTIDEQMYRTIPKKYIKRRIIANSLKRTNDLSGIPGFYQEEDWGWTFSNAKGFFVPVFDENNKIQALSMHLDKAYNGTTDIWFSSSGKINGTGTKNWISRNNITEDTETVILTDNLILSNLIKGVLNIPVIAFLSISNSYQILKAIDNTNIQNIIFTVMSEENQNLDYIIHRVFKDLIPLGFNLDTKYVGDYKDILKDDFLYSYRLEKVA